MNDEQTNKITPMLVQLTISLEGCEIVEQTEIPGRYFIAEDDVVYTKPILFVFVARRQAGSSDEGDLSHGTDRIPDQTDTQR